MGAVHLNEILVDFYKRLNCDYPLIIKDLIKEFEGHFECLNKNTKNI